MSKELVVYPVQPVVSELMFITHAQTSAREVKHNTATIPFLRADITIVPEEYNSVDTVLTFAMVNETPIHR